MFNIQYFNTIFSPQALRAQSDQQLWMSNNRLLENAGLGLSRGPGPGHPDTPGNIGNMKEWGGGGTQDLPPWIQPCTAAFMMVNCSRFHIGGFAEEKMTVKMQSQCHVKMLYARIFKAL